MDAAEVSKHNTKDSCWVIINGRVWDVTDFLSEHPGGAKIILRQAGRDATKAYSTVHNADLVVETLSPDLCKGDVDPSTVAKAKAKDEAKDEAKTAADSDPKMQVVAKAPKPASKWPPLGAMVNLDDFEKVAQQYLTDAGWAYYSSGAEDELSVMDARRVFREINLRPRVLRDVSSVSTSVDILGHPSSLPIYITPTGSAKHAHDDAEPLIVKAAGKEGLIYCMPTRPSATLESIFGSRVNESQPLFFQLYVNSNREKAKEQIRRAEALGAKAIWVTVDSPVIGKRERDERLTVVDDDEDDENENENEEKDKAGKSAGFAKTTSAGLLNAALTWKDFSWMRETTKLPLVVKGIQSVEDALLAYQYGLDGIILSNHGGRSQDTAQAPMLTLLEIHRYAPQLLRPDPTGRRFQVFLDGGVRRGTDVIKALALGATAVGVGRPVLYSMCCNYGARGIRKLVGILRAEIATNMALVGAAKPEDLVPEMVNSERAEVGVSRRVKL